MDDLISFLRARLDEREGLLLHSQAINAPSPVSIKTLLGEVKAKRRILDEFSWEGAETRAIMYLAQPYAGQQGWRDEWTI